MNHKIFFGFGLLFSVTMVTAQDIKSGFPQLGKSSTKEVIAAMTTEEKIWLVIGGEAILKKPQPEGNAANGIIGFTENKVPGAAGTTYAIPRLGIPSIVLADGPAGVRISPRRKDDSTRTYYATGYPVGTLLASSWDTALVNKVGKAFGNEVLAYGIDIILAPGINIQRNPLNGRNFEYFSEDPLVAGRMAAAIINGLQSNGIGTSLKHFAANNQETRRLNINAEISERALREVYLKAFQIALKTSNPWTVMSSYNKLNGNYAAERYDLLTEILRNEWKYNGLIVTDWGAGKKVIDQIKGGHSLIMPGRYDQVESLRWALANNKLDAAVLDNRVETFLNLVLQTPTFKKYQYSDKPDLAAHAQVARMAATEGMVLLKNNNYTLPLTKSISKIATFGNTSYDLIAGGTGSGDVNKAYVISLAKGLATAGYNLNSTIENLYQNYLTDFKANRPKLANAGSGRPQIPELEISDDLIEKQSAEADIAIVTIGKNAGEGADRNLENNYQLVPYEKNLIKRISMAFKNKGKRTIVILNIGGVIDMSLWKDDADAILLAWQPGQEGGHAIADLLSGKVNPSGKLAITFPETYSDVPSSKNFPGTPKEKPENVIYEEGIYTGYRYYDTYKIKPAYEFGYGLSYTTFAFSNLKLSSKKFSKNINASITVKNTGSAAGKEVVQIYITAPAKSIDKPMQELKAFAKTKLLQPGETQTLKFYFTAYELASYLTAEAAWMAEPGVYTIKAGTSSRAIKQSKTFKLSKQMVTEKVTNQVLPTNRIENEFKGM